MLRSFFPPRIPFLSPRIPRHFQGTKAISFRALLVVPLLGQVTLVVGLMGYFSIRNSQRSAQTVAWQLQADMGQRVEQHLDHYLTVPQRLTAVNHQAIQQGMLSLDRVPQFEQFFVTQMQQFPETGYLNFGAPTGEFLGVERRAGELLIIDMLQESGGQTGRSFRLNPSGGRGAQLEANPLPFGIQEEGWFKDAVKAQKPI
jgi:hypothetical protein